MDSGMRSDLDVATREWLECAAYIVSDTSGDMDADISVVLQKVNDVRERNGLPLLAYRFGEGIVG